VTLWNLWNLEEMGSDERKLGHKMHTLEGVIETLAPLYL
jgi:hypothetical protein